MIVRRLIALGVGVVILILILLGIRGCLNARKQRTFENYVSDLSSVATQSRQVSTEFFRRLEQPGKLTQLSFKAAVSADRGTAESLLQHVQELTAPDQVAEGQRELVQAFELRRDALGVVADQISTALGTEGRRDAIQQILSAMRELLASDVLYSRARDSINASLKSEGIPTDKTVPEASFLPEPVTTWLDYVSLGGVLAQVAGSTGAAGGGTHGLAILQTTLTPGKVILSPDTPSTISGNPPFEIEVQVQNQGNSNETDVIVDYSLEGGGTTTEQEATISRIKAGETESARLPIEDPPSGDELSLTVTVLPVPGETISDNNESTYGVTFGS